MALDETDKHIISERGERNGFYVFCGGKMMRDIKAFSVLQK